jgi:HD-like signal output (HDOD) protein
MNTILAGLGSLKALPGTIARVVAMIGDHNASITQIEQAVKTDEALALTILRIANSVRYGRPGKSFTLKEGISRLGLRTLEQIVLEQQSTGMFYNAGLAYSLQRGALWRSAVGGAICAESIARRCGFESPDMCFVCGLLRDVGKLAFEASYAHGYADMVLDQTRPDRTFLEAERAAFGFDHAQLGAALATRWGLPRRIADAIGFHHDPPAGPPTHDRLFDIVHAADIVTLWAGLAVGVDGLQYRLAEHVRTGLELDRHKAELLIAEAWTAVREAEADVLPPRAAGATA